MAKIKNYLIIVFLILLSNGCATAGEFPAGTLFSQSPAIEKKISRRRELTFPLKNSQHITPDYKRPETIVQFALGLAEKGEVAKAAAFFLEVADSERANSRWNRFRIECVAAASSLYLQAQDLNRFHESVTRLRNELDRFQLASAEPEIAVLLAIDDKLTGRPTVLVREIPWPVRDLFQGKIR